MSKPLLKTVELFPKPAAGKVDQSITSTRSGRVQAFGSFWYAQFYKPEGQTTIAPGESVMIVGRQGIRLLVVPMDDVGIRI